MERLWDNERLNNQTQMKALKELVTKVVFGRWEALREWQNNIDNKRKEAQNKRDVDDKNENNRRQMQQ